MNLFDFCDEYNVEIGFGGKVFLWIDLVVLVVLVIYCGIKNDF